MGDGARGGPAAARARPHRGCTTPSSSSRSRRASRPISTSASKTNRALGHRVRPGLRRRGPARSTSTRSSRSGAPGGGPALDSDAHLDTIAPRARGGRAPPTGFHTESDVLAALARARGRGSLDGRIDAVADLAHQSARVRRLDLRLSRAHAAGLPRVVRAPWRRLRLPRGRAAPMGSRWPVTGVEATAKGRVLLTKQAIELGLDVVASDLARLLGELGLPPLAEDGADHGAPRAGPSSSRRRRRRRRRGRHRGPGVALGPRELKARFRPRRRPSPRLDELSGAAFGGELRAHGHS